MKIKINFYKPTGKWYTETTITLPDTTNLYDRDILKLICETQQEVTHPLDFIITTENKGTCGNFFRYGWNLDLLRTSFKNLEYKT